MPQHEDVLIAVGHIISAHGLSGQVKVFSHTSPRENIVAYSPWVIEQGGIRKVFIISGVRQGKNVIARLKGVTTRDQAQELVTGKILINQSQLPDLDDGDYYWAQLLGLTVLSQQGGDLGKIDHMLETGANDVMVVQGDRERLIPFVMGEVVKSVDLNNRQIIVDWQQDY